MTSSDDPALDAFASYVARVEDGEQVDFEMFCAEHSQHASRLRKLHAGWQRAGALGAGAPEPGPIPAPRGVPAEPHEDERYEVLDEVATGGMGTILRVRDRKLQRVLAMKVLRKDVAPNPRALARFLEEAQVTAQLDHPGIVPVHEVGTTSSGEPFYTMPLVRGRDLREVFGGMGEDGWTRTRVLGVLVRVCEALAAAHARGVVHRDLKPGNVMVGAYGETFVMDWGLARVLEARADPIASLRHTSSGESSSWLTVDGDVVGTPAYMAPEQARGELENVDARSDVYAVGAMLYHLLVGRMPYLDEGAEMSSRSILHRVLQGAPPPVEELVPDVPPELAAICARAMAREASERYPGVQELAADLQAFLEVRVVGAYRTGPLVELKTWMRRNRGLAVATGAALALALGGLAAVGYVQSEGRKAEAELRGIADDNLARFLRMRDVPLVADLLAEARDDLVISALERPQIESLASSMQDWLERADGVLSRRTQHEESLRALENAALTPDPSVLETERALEVTRAELEKRQAIVDQARLDAFAHRDIGQTKGELSRLASEVADLEAALAGERWRFASYEDQFLYGTLGPLVADLVELDSVREEMIERLVTAESLASVSIDDYAAAWADAAARVAADDRYEGFELAPQLGLIPLGPDPSSGLEEFAHLLSGDVAVRGAGGRFELEERTGIVLVLIPGGRFPMGATRISGELNFDPHADSDEFPVHEVDLDPFFIGKHEVTQGQWLNLTETNPSRYGLGTGAPGRVTTLVHPVESVAWSACDRVFRSVGLLLPTEAQWEYAARGGTLTVWWTGNEKTSIAGAANVCDVTFDEWSEFKTVFDPELRDGYPLHAPVDAFEPNPFGLQGVIGNSVEWCRDWYGTYDLPVRAGDGLREARGSRNRIWRGSCMFYRATAGRSAARGYGPPEQPNSETGARASRMVTR